MECMQEGSGMRSHTRQVSVAQHNKKVIESLNVDCWRLILSHLNVQEILQTERTCKDWQKMVLDHLAHRPIAVSQSCIKHNTLLLRTSNDAWASFKRWLKKCGHCVQDVDVDCRYFKDVVEVLRDNCPNLIAMKLIRLKKILPPTTTQHFKKLKKIIFDYCDVVTDDCVSQLLTNDLEVINITYNQRITGRFLYNLKPDNNIKFLTLKHCRAFKFPYLLFVADRLTSLRLLKLCKRNRSKIEIRNKLHLLLDKMPNLLELSIEVYDMLARYDNSRRLAESNVFYESVSRLKKMRLLTANFEVWDHHLEAIARSCTDLMLVVLNCKHITRRGLDALCRHVGPQLFELSLSRSNLTDDDVVACVYACPKLLSLFLSDCPELESAVPRVAAARQDMRASAPDSDRFFLSLPLTLYMRNWDYYGEAEENSVIVEFTSEGNFTRRLY